MNKLIDTYVRRQPVGEWTLGVSHFIKNTDKIRTTGKDSSRE